MMIHLDSIFTPAAQAQLFTTQAYNDGSTGDQNYGLGFRISKTEKSNRTLIHHGGSSIGGRAFLLKVVEEDLVIAICANSHTSLFRPANYDLQEVYDLAKIFMDD